MEAPGTFRRQPLGSATAAIALAIVSLAVAAALPTPARAQTSPQPFGPYDGTNPFICELQQLGTGTEYPDPDADPLCVEFDKTSQNVTDFGLVDFLSKEPARVAAATPKCFYFQRDHWTGSVVQGEQPELWHWDGNYFFDKAQGLGGVNAANFRVGGQPMDGSQYAPPEYQPFFEEGGGGGVLTRLEGAADPECAARVDTPEEREQLYSGEPQFPKCIGPGGNLRRRKVGKVRLGMSRDDVLERLAAPRNHVRGTDRWCVTGGASLRVAYGRGSPRGVALIRTTVRGHSERNVGPHTRAKLARRLGFEPRFELGKASVLEAPRRNGRRLFAGIRNRRVRWLALSDPGRIVGERATKRALHRTG